MARLYRSDTKMGEVVRIRTPADPKLKPAIRCMIERYGLASENGRMSQSVAEHQRANSDASGMRREPGIGDHCLIHGVILGTRRYEVIHARNTSESRVLGGSRHRDQPIERHPHLWKEKMKLHSRISIA